MIDMAYCDCFFLFPHCLSGCHNTYISDIKTTDFYKRPLHVETCPIKLCGKQHNMAFF